MITHHFAPVSDIAVHLTLTRNGKRTDLPFSQENGWLGITPLPKDVITISIGVDPATQHECYTLNTKKEKVAKKAVDEGIYEKSVTVTNRDYGLGLKIAGWPGNMFCLDMAGKSYHLGLYFQRNALFFVIEETVSDSADKQWVEGEVKWFSLLRGFGAVASKNPLFDHRIYWENLPQKRANMHRYLDSGDIIVPKIIEDIPFSKTEFRTEIKEVKFVKYAN